MVDKKELPDQGAQRGTAIQEQETSEIRFKDGSRPVDEGHNSRQLRWIMEEKEADKVK